MTDPSRPSSRRGRTPGPTVLRRSRRTYEANRLQGAPRAIVIAVAVVVGSRAGVIGAVVGLVAAVVALVAVHRALTRVAVEVHDDGLVHRGAVSTRRWDWDDVGSVLHASRVSTTSVQPEVTWVVPRDRRGRRLFQVTSMTWSPESLATLVELLGAHVPVLDEPGPGSLRAVARRHRGAFSFAQRRPVVFSVLVVVVGIAVVMAGSYYGYELLGRSTS